MPSRRDVRARSIRAPLQKQLSASKAPMLISCLLQEAIVRGPQNAATQTLIRIASGFPAFLHIPLCDGALTSVLAFHWLFGKGVPRQTKEAKKRG